MKIQTPPSQISGQLPAFQVKAEPQDPRDEHVAWTSETKEHLTTSLFTAVLFGGSTALGAYYQDVGIVAATALSVAGSLAYNTDSGEGIVPLVSGISGAACAALGFTVGPGLSMLAAGAVGACLGYALSAGK